MSSKVNFPDEVKELVNEVIAKNNLDSTSKIVYSIGSELGEGFLSKSVSVSINSQNEELSLFIKYALNAKLLGGLDLNKIYENEIFFYEEILPTYMDFLKEKDLETSFRSVPKFYGASKKIVALENLKQKGYQLCDKVFIGNDEHITLVFKTYAKFHALSFAYRNQKPEEYKKLVSPINDVFDADVNNDKAKRHLEAMKNEVKKFLEELDPKKDKYILDRSENLPDKIMEFNKSMTKVKFENCVITQGDCWCNNMMFRYEDDKRVPMDVKLVDWQIIRSASPVLDLSYFYYTAASISKETLSKLDYYLNMYHEELSTQIRKLGSDPEILYPLTVFKKEWKQFCKHGYRMSIIILKVMLCSKDEAPDFDVIHAENLTPTEIFLLSNKEDYHDRLKNLTEHFLLNDFF